MTQLTAVETQVAKATEADIPAILTMIEGLADYEWLSNQVTANEDNLRKSLFSERPAAEVLLAFVAGEPVGFAIFFETFCSILGRRGCFLDHLFVRPGYRGQRVGEKLLKEVAHISQVRKYGRLDWMVLDCNDSAIGFYKKHHAELLLNWTKCRLDESAINVLVEEPMTVLSAV